MATAIPINIPVTTAAPIPLLTLPPNADAWLETDIEDVFSVAKVPDDGKIPKMAPIVGELRRLSPEWNSPSYDQVLLNHVDLFKDAEKVVERLSRELDFFRVLYEPSERFRVYPVDEYIFDYDGAGFPTILFEASARVYGCTYFTSYPKALSIDYIQGLASSTSEEQREALGETWFDALMERAIRAHSSLRDFGIELMLRIDFKQFRLPRMVRDRYFVSRKAAAGIFHPLNPDRARVKKAMGAA